MSSTQSCSVPERVDLKTTWRESGAQLGSSLRPIDVRGTTSRPRPTP